MQKKRIRQNSILIYDKKKKKTCSKLRLEGNKGKFLNLIKGIYWKPTAKLILIGERLKAFP